MASDDKKNSPAPKNETAVKKQAAAKKDQGQPRDKTTPDADVSKAEGGANSTITLHAEMHREIDDSLQTSRLTRSAMLSVVAVSAARS